MIIFNLAVQANTRIELVCTAHLQHYLSSKWKKEVVVEAQRKSWLPLTPCALVAYPMQIIIGKSY